MGLIQAALTAASGILADSWKEYFYCDAIPENVLVTKGQKRVRSGSSNVRGNDNIITTGSVIAVADGQCMIIVEQGKVIELCAEPGEFIFDSKTSPSIFAGNLGDSVKQTFNAIIDTITFGGDRPKDQRVYYFNTKELVGNKYGTANPVPFRVVDERAGIDIDISLRCFGEYSYRIVDPILFYTNVCGNVTSVYKREQIEGQLKSELLTALQPAFAKMSAMGIRYSAVVGHTTEMADALNEALSMKWGQLRGLKIVSFGISSLKASEEDEKMLKEMQKNAAYKDPSLGAATLVGAQAQAMQNAAQNSGGAAVGFMGMNMAAQTGGISAQGLYQMGAQNAAAKEEANTWVCPKCGTKASGKFCPECGEPAPGKKNAWTCPTCGKENQGKFCTECGTKKPAGEPQYKCDKCGWEPEDPAHPPKFCPECGDPFGEEDIVK